MQRDARTDARELLYLTGISELFINQLRRPRLAKSAEARAAVSQSPRGGLNGKVVEAFDKRGLVHERVLQHHRIVESR